MSAWADSGGVPSISMTRDSQTGQYSVSFNLSGGPWDSIKLSWCRGDPSKTLWNKNQALGAAGVCSGAVYGGGGFGDAVETAPEGEILRGGQRSYPLVGVTSGEWYIAVTLDNGEASRPEGTTHHDGGNHPFIHAVYLQ